MNLPLSDSCYEVKRFFRLRGIGVIFGQRYLYQSVAGSEN